MCESVPEKKFKIQTTNELLEEFEERLQAHGVANYLIAVTNPDKGAVDKVRYFGSVYWRLGAAQDIVDSVKYFRDKDRYYEDLDEDDDESGEETDDEVEVK